jgi:crotonobetainyl-CoA hydratase
MGRQVVSRKIDGRVTVLSIDRPEVLNAINTQVLHELDEALNIFEEDRSQLVAVLTGAGDRAFSSGADLKELATQSRSAPNFGAPVSSAQKGFLSMTRRRVSKPLIGAVNGLAYGGGAEIALSMDLLVASENASFCLPEAKVGRIAGAGGLVRLPRQVPLKVAMKMALTGEPISASEALQWGLVNSVVPLERLMQETMELAEVICRNAPLSVRASKSMIYRCIDRSLDDDTVWESVTQMAALVGTSYDAGEGGRAFAEKRDPVWEAR